MKSLGKLALSAFLCLAPIHAAESRRTVIDQDENENPIILQLQGYCDFNGDDCGPKGLGYSVDFGSGALNSVIVYGNGLLSFGDTAIDLAQLYDPVDGLPAEVTDYPAPVISPGLNNNIESDFQGSGDDVFSQSAELSIDPDGTIRATYFFCATPQQCRFNPYSATLKPVLGGYQVTFAYQGSSTKFDGSGFFIAPNLSQVFTPTEARTFLLPATFNGLQIAAVPEPETWLMMMGGFLAIGSAVRRSRRKTIAPAC